MIVTGSILLPIRMIGAIIALLVAILWVNLASLGLTSSHEERRPCPPLRRQWLLGPCRILARVLLFFFGYLWIHETSQKEKEDKEKDKPRIHQPPPPPPTSIVVVNHIGFAELLFLAYRYGCCFVSKESNRKLPVIGRVSELMQSIFVERGDDDGAVNSSRNHYSKIVNRTTAAITTTEQILERARSPVGQWPPLAICPEGTTTTGHVMIHFHTSAFRAGQSVQPVVVHMPFSPRHGYDPSFCCCSNIVLHILCLMTQPRNHMHVHHLAVYTPNDAEKTDAQLFANNVRRCMVNALNKIICHDNERNGKNHHAMVGTFELEWMHKLQFETTEKKRQLGRRLLAKRYYGKDADIFLSPPVFTHDAFGRPLLVAEEQVKKDA